MVSFAVCHLPDERDPSGSTPASQQFSIAVRSVDLVGQEIHEQAVLPAAVRTAFGPAGDPTGRNPTLVYARVAAALSALAPAVAGSAE
jgi:hypothetical protein